MICYVFVSTFICNNYFDLFYICCLLVIEIIENSTSNVREKWQKWMVNNEDALPYGYLFYQLADSETGIVEEQAVRNVR